MIRPQGKAFERYEDVDIASERSVAYSRDYLATVQCVAMSAHWRYHGKCRIAVIILSRERAAKSHAFWRCSVGKTSQDGTYILHALSRRWPSRAAYDDYLARLAASLSLLSSHRIASRRTSWLASPSGFFAAAASGTETTTALRYLTTARIQGKKHYTHSAG